MFKVIVIPGIPNHSVILLLLLLSFTLNGHQRHGGVLCASRRIYPLGLLDPPSSWQASLRPDSEPTSSFLTIPYVGMRSLGFTPSPTTLSPTSSDVVMTQPTRRVIHPSLLRVARAPARIRPIHAWGSSHNCSYASLLQAILKLHDWTFLDGCRVPSIRFCQEGRKLHALFSSEACEALFEAYEVESVILDPGTGLYTQPDAERVAFIQGLVSLEQGCVAKVYPDSRRRKSSPKGWKLQSKSR